MYARCRAAVINITEWGATPNHFFPLRHLQSPFPIPIYVTAYCETLVPCKNSDRDPERPPTCQNLLMIAPKRRDKSFSVVVLVSVVSNYQDVSGRAAGSVLEQYDAHFRQRQRWNVLTWASTRDLTCTSHTLVFIYGVTLLATYVHHRYVLHVYLLSGA